jgi:hypothetical protein
MRSSRAYTGSPREVIRSMLATASDQPRPTLEFPPPEL